MRGIVVVSLNQSLLSPLKPEVNLNIQAMHIQEIKTLNHKFASFQQQAAALGAGEKILESKWSLLQQQKNARSNMDSVFKSYINNPRGQPDTR